MDVKLEKVLEVLLACFIILAIPVSCSVWFIRENGHETKITDESKITWLEASDEANHEEIKSLIRECLAENGIEPDKVAFWAIPKEDAVIHYSDHTSPYTTNYSLTTYYKVNGEWYQRTDKPFSDFISDDLDHEIILLVNS